MLLIDKEKLLSAVKPFGKSDNYKDSIIHFEIAAENKTECIKIAEKALNEPIPQLLLSGFREFEKNGNRIRYEKKCFRKREMLLELTMGEVSDGFKGRYLEKAMDVLWSILEETTWVVPAHRQKENYPECKWLDIFSAATGAAVAVAYFFLKKEIEKEMPDGFTERVLYELRHRITEPFVSDFSPFHSWKGTEGWYVNNWNPWIVTNVLTVTVLTEKNIEVRRHVAERSAIYLNRYLSFCPDDGSCVEGAAYFFKSNACIFDICELYCELTDGEYNLENEPYLKKLIEYLPNMYAGKGNYFTVGDCGAHNESSSTDIIRFLKRLSAKLNSDSIIVIANDIAEEETEFTCNDYFTAYRTVRNLTVNSNMVENTGTLTESYMDSVQIMTLRRCGCTAFFKGGSNNEPHGHNDCGEFQLYYKGKPLFIDPGVEVYSASSFSEKNWCRRSFYHNAPILNGTEQPAGYQGSPDIKYKASEVKADIENGILKMQLKEAYPDNAGIISANRIMQLADGIFKVTDIYDFCNLGRYEFHLLTAEKPRFKDSKLIVNIEGESIECSFNFDYNYEVEEIPVNDERIRTLWKKEKLYLIKIFSDKKSDSFCFFVKLK